MSTYRCCGFDPSGIDQLDAAKRHLAMHVGADSSTIFNLRQEIQCIEERERREKLARKLVRVRRVYLDNQGYITNKGSYGVGYLHDYRGIGQKVWCVFINDEPICEVRASDKEHAKMLAYRDSYVRSTIIRMETDK